MFSRVAPSVYVSDIPTAIAFYQNVLGFKLDNVDDPPARAVVTEGSAVLHLDLNPELAGTSRVHMLVTDLDEVCARLTKANVKLIQPPTVQPWGLKDIITPDPDGNALELAQPIKK